LHLFKNRIVKEWIFIIRKYTVKPFAEIKQNFFLDTKPNLFIELLAVFSRCISAIRINSRGQTRRAYAIPSLSKVENMCIDRIRSTSFSLALHPGRSRRPNDHRQPIGWFTRCKSTTHSINPRRSVYSVHCGEFARDASKREEWDEWRKSRENNQSCK